MKLMRLWGDLGVWGRYGISAVAAVIILAIVLKVLS